MLPAALRLLDTKRLAVLADGALQYIPFSLLGVSHGKSLVSRYEIVSLPSASALAALSHAQRCLKNIDCFADLVFQPNDERLSDAVAKTKSVATSLVSLNAHQLTRSATEVGLSDLVRLPFAR